MRGTRILIFALLLGAITANAADRGNLLVDSYGKLLLIARDGTQRVLADSSIIAALSPDGRNLAFTRDDNPRAFPKSSQVLFVVPLDSGTPREITRLSPGEHFESIGWTPDASAILYQGTGGNLFIMPLAAAVANPRNLERGIRDSAFHQMEARSYTP